MNSLKFVKFLLVFSVIFCPINLQVAYCQTAIPLTPVIQPSPTVQAMQKYGDIPVTLYTGLPNISIPLYTIKNHDINIPISLSYHASGIKVAEEASNVGLGWVLNAGGVVSRKIIGSDDFMTPSNYFSGPSYIPGDIDNGLKPQYTIQATPLLNLYQPNSTNITQWNLTNALNVSPEVDFQPDEFYFNIGDHSGKFLLNRNYQPILQKQEKVDITVLPNSNGIKDGSSWTIQTVDGYTYYFQQVETYIDPNGPTTPHITATYLTQIVSPTGSKVTFHYNVSQSNYVNPPGNYTQSIDDGSLPGSLWYTSSQKYIALTLGQVATTGQGKIYQSVELSYIDYDNGQVQFSFGQTRTNDLPGDYQLNSISVFIKDSNGNLSSSPLKTFNFSYSDFQGIGTATSNNFPIQGTPPINYIDRLRLDQIVETDVYNGQTVTSKPYNFTYYTNDTYPTSSNSLPYKSSFARDHWGYFNGNVLNSSLIPSYTSQSSNQEYFYAGIMGPERNANGTYMQAFSLSDIQYPTGGTTHFDYQANDCDEQKSEINDLSFTPYPYTILPGNQSPYSQTWNVGGTLPNMDMTDEYVGSDGFQANNLRVTFILGSSTSLTPGMQQGGALFVNVYNINNLNQVVAYLDPASITGTTISNQGEVISCTMEQKLPPGIYVIKPGYSTANNTYAQYLQHVSITYNWNTQVNSNYSSTNTHPITYSTAGGLRILRITDKDGINPPKIKKYIYHYNVGQTPEFSYGRRMSRPDYSYFEQSEDIYSVINGNQTTNYPVYPEHSMHVSDSNIPLNGSAQGMVVGYDQVTELYGENGENGETIYTYHNNPDLIEPYTAQRTFFNDVTTYLLPRRRPYNSNIPDQMNGLLLSQTDYKNVNGQFIPIKSVNNTYFKNTSIENDVYGFEDHIQPHFTKIVNSDAGVESDSPPTYTSIPPTDRFFYNYSPLQSQWIYQATTDVKIYTSSDPTKYSENITSYYYDNPLHYLPTRVTNTNSKGEIITQTTGYPQDFTTLSGFDDVSKGVNNLIANHLLNAPVEKFIQKTNSDGTNLRTISGVLTAYAGTGPSVPGAVYQLQSVTPLTNFSSYATSGAKNSAYWPALYFDKFDAANSNLLQQHKYKDVYYSYQWGYNNAYPIAQCKNASVNQFFYQGFEGSTSSGVNSTGIAHTGRCFYSGGNYTVSWTVPDGLSYVISYWYFNGTSWTYSGERSYTGSGYNLTGGSGYDDIRIYPSEGQMSTYTYDTGVGMTSSTDPKGETTYFEYDGLLRLMNIKDANGNIVKNFSYNFATVPVGGQTIFYSAAQAAIYQKSTGCTGSATLGTSVLYTAPPGKYTSTISQSYADGLAITDVANNAQNYADNNGGCVVPLFYSDPISASYTPVCPIGYSSPPVTINVPYGQYTSSVSKAAANQSAQSYAQSQANAQGTCAAPNLTFSVINNTGVNGFVLLFSGTNSINYNVPATGNGSVSIPQGTYTLTINPPPASGNYPNYKFLLGGRAPVTAPGVTFNNPQVNISQGGELILNIQNP